MTSTQRLAPIVHQPSEMMMPSGAALAMARLRASSVWLQTANCACWEGRGKARRQKQRRKQCRAASVAAKESQYCLPDHALQPAIQDSAERRKPRQSMLSATCAGIVADESERCNPRRQLPPTRPKMRRHCLLDCRDALGTGSCKWAA